MSLPTLPPESNREALGSAVLELTNVSSSLKALAKGLDYEDSATWGFGNILELLARQMDRSLEILDDGIVRIVIGGEA